MLACDAGYLALRRAAAGRAVTYRTRLKQRSAIIEVGPPLQRIAALWGPIRRPAIQRRNGKCSHYREDKQRGFHNKCPLVTELQDTQGNPLLNPGNHVPHSALCTYG